MGNQEGAGKVLSLRLCVGSRDPMKIVKSAVVIAGEGIDGDRHRRTDGRRSDRQVLLMDRETIDLFGLQEGDVRENITVEGLDFTKIMDGDRVCIGPDVVLRITGDCEPCGRMDEIREGLRNSLEGQRGLLAYAEKGGLISLGDNISKLSP